MTTRRKKQPPALPDSCETFDAQSGIGKRGRLFLFWQKDKWQVRCGWFNQTVPPDQLPDFLDELGVD